MKRKGESGIEGGAEGNEGEDRDRGEGRGVEWSGEERDRTERRKMGRRGRGEG